MRCPECKTILSDFWVPDGVRVQVKYYCKVCDKTFLPSQVQEDRNESYKLP